MNFAVGLPFVASLSHRDTKQRPGCSRIRMLSLQPSDTADHRHPLNCRKGPSRQSVSLIPKRFWSGQLPTFVADVVGGRPVIYMPRLRSVSRSRFYGNRPHSLNLNAPYSLLFGILGRSDLNPDI